MKWALYNLLFAAVYPFLLPGFLVRMLRRGGYAARMGDRFALYPEGLFGKDRPLYDSHKDFRRETGDFVWIHAVSVGEVQVAGQLMREWRKVEPDVRFCFSTTSSTGWKIAEKELASLNLATSQPRNPATPSDILIYNPLDFPNFVKSALRAVRPRTIVLTESEIWPNFILQAKKMGIPLFLINARVSDRSAPRYKAAKWFFGEVLGCFTRIFAQSDLDKARLVAAGAPEDKVEVTGSFKFDVARRNEAKERELRAWIFGACGDIPVAAPTERAEDGAATFLSPQILLAGSTWPGEDEALLKIYKKILSGSVAEAATVRGKRPILVIAPRHFEKADAVEANVRKYGFDCIRRSRESKSKDEVEQWKEKFHCSPSTKDFDYPPVYLADTTGELMGLYGIADVVFVGKSLCAHGSQNMIEPCLCGKPTLVGPYTENFRPVMSDLLASDAIIQVKDAKELEEKIVELLAADSGDRNVAAPTERAEAGAYPPAEGSPEGGAMRGATFLSPQELGVRAKAAVEKRLGVVAKCVEEIRGAL